MKKFFQKIWYYICHPTNACDSCGKQVEHRNLVEEFTEGGFLVCDICLQGILKSNKMTKLNINEMHERWMKDPGSLTAIDASLVKAYSECVINNPDASDYRATMNLTDQFEELLSLLQSYKI